MGQGRAKARGGKGTFLPFFTNGYIMVKETRLKLIKKPIFDAENTGNDYYLTKLPLFYITKMNKR